MKEAADIEISEKKQLQLKNNFISTPFRYTQMQLDLIFMVLTIYNKDESDYSFHLQKLSNITRRRYRVKDIFEESQELVSRVYTIVENHPDAKTNTDAGEAEEDADYDDKISWSCYNLFSRINYDRGIIYVTLTKDAMGLFAHTKSNFTYIQLKSALLLRNKYAKRLYMWLASWANVGQVEISATKLRRFLTPTKDEEQEKYKLNHDFIALVKRAVADINAITELHVELDGLKQARSVVTFRFIINRRSGEYRLQFDDDAIDFNNSIEKNEFLSLCIQRCFTKDQALEMWDNGCRAEDFKKIIDAANRQARKAGNIKDPTAYLVACFAKAGYLTIDKSEKSLKKITKTLKKKQFLEERARIITMIRQALAGGADATAFTSFINSYKINADELQ